MAKLFAKSANSVIKHGRSPRGKYFFNSAMMAEAKRDDAMRNAVEKRAGNEPPAITHIPCGCGCGIIGSYISKKKG